MAKMKQQEAADLLITALGGEKKAAKTVRKSEPVVAIDPVAYAVMKKQEAIEAAAEKGDEGAANQLIAQETGMLGLILKSLNDTTAKSASRMSFEINPDPAYQTYAGMYRDKLNLTPDHVIKRIIGASGDELVCQILQARSNMAASFGRPRMSRFANGFEFEEIPGINLPDDEEFREQLRKRITAAEKFIWNCGHGPAKKEYYTPNFSQFLKMITRDGEAFGRLAVERLFVINPRTGKQDFFGFRPADAGTIYHISPNREDDISIRQRAIQLLAQLKGERIEPAKADEALIEKRGWKWVQVIDGVPRQVFTDNELVVYNRYPVTNVEYNGYPLTPIDQALNAIVTHISITIHNKLYFQHGRAARGMMIFKSDSMDESVAQKIRLQFHQSINSAQNSWRMPVFGIGTEDELSWQSIDVSGRDAEFQYLMDSNARVILSAFQMSPEELPGYAHLARGTNTQSLSESDNEWKLTAARDVGLRPLLSDLQDFLNKDLLPFIDPELAKTHRLILAGLEKDAPEKEAARLQTDMNIHMTYNDVLQAVEKETIDDKLGGNLPMNQLFVQNVLAPYLSVGEILENFFGRKGAAKDPRFAYYRDPFWVQQQQLLLQKAQMAMQNSMMQQQAAMGGAPGGDPNDPNGGGDPNGAPPQDEQAPPNAEPAEKAEIEARNLAKKEAWLAKNYMQLEKSITNNGRQITKAILARHKEVVDKSMKTWAEQSKKAVDEIADIVGGKKK